MTRTLAVVAGAGIAVSAVCLSIAVALGADDEWGDLPFGLDADRCPFDRAAGPQTTRNFTWSGGDSISIRVPGVIQYRPGTARDVVVTGPAELVDHLHVGNRSIELDCNTRLRDALAITLPGQAFREFALNGSGRLTLHDLDQQRLDLVLRGSGSVEASGSAGEVAVEVRGSGDARLRQVAVGRLRVRVNGSGDVAAAASEEADVGISGSGDVDLGNTPVKTLRLKIRGSGGAEAAPQDSASIDIAGSGDARLLSRPRALDTQISGSGKVINAPATP